MSKAKLTPLKAGTARVDITPKMGTQIAGDIGRRRPAELVVDPIYANVLVLESAGRRLCLLSMDLCIITEKWIHEIRRQAGRRFGLEEKGVLTHVVQNHAAPALGHAFVGEDCKLFPPEHPWLNGGDDAYHEWVLPRIVDGIGRAVQAMEPVWWGASSGIEARVAFNRRFILRDGTAVTHGQWKDPQNLLQIEGPIDPELGVMCFTTEDLRIKSMLLHHTCHPTHGYPERYITGGWPGAWVRGMIESAHAGCVPLVINGCCGNVHHSNHLDPRHDSTFPTLGKRLTETACEVLRKIRYRDQAVLDCRTISIPIPLRELDLVEVDKARKLLAANPQPMWKDETRTAVQWDWVYAVAMIDLAEKRQKRPFYDCEIQALRIGDCAVLGLPGEPFVEGQLAIKRHSPARRTFVAHMATGYGGYIPTAEALKRGGYETRTANWSALAPEALDTISAESVKLLKELFAQ